MASDTPSFNTEWLRVLAMPSDPWRSLVQRALPNLDHAIPVGRDQETLLHREVAHFKYGACDAYLQICIAPRITSKS